MASVRIQKNGIIRYLFILPIILYQKKLRTFHNRQCIYTPSCSNYTIEAILKYGPLKGWKIGLLRIKRCNGALYRGGHDPIN